MAASDINGTLRRWPVKGDDGRLLGLLVEMEIGGRVYVRLAL